ncbi:MAG: hypothetical protein E6G70_13505 [Alphaproteobacteria bacterium]|nr:MAG: hypothetical protein E6G70_13505 [Alphaproteobacteria bacterium]
MIAAILFDSTKVSAFRPYGFRPLLPRTLHFMQRHSRGTDANRTEADFHGDKGNLTRWRCVTMADTALLPQKSSIWWIFLLQGFAGIVLGLMLITEPGATVVALTTVLGFYWLITGLLGLVQVFVDRSTT